MATSDNSVTKWLAAATVSLGVGVAVLAAVIAFRPQPVSPMENIGQLSTDEIKRDKFQAVFLTNGQVYFGKLEMFKDAYKLTDVYYFATEQSVSIGNNPEVKKLGDELHKPDDVMFIPKTQVLFWENLRSSSLQGGLR